MSGLDFSLVASSWEYLLRGLYFSLMLTAFAFATGLMIGTVLALTIHTNVPVLGHLARAYVALVRSIPLIMVLFWFFFLVPLFLGWIAGNSRPIAIGATWTAFITFALFEAAYYCEIIRVGLRAVPRGQFEAAKALSLSTPLTYMLIILPQVFRATVPIILTQTIILFQDTSLVYVLSLTDLLGAASKQAQITGRLTEFYIVVALIYLVLCFSASQLVRWLQGRVRMA